jgi:glycerol kinase
MNSDMKAIGGEGIISLRVDGGASANDLLMQMQSDISGIDVIRASNPEATAAGAAYLAGLAVGFFKDRDEIYALASTGKIFIAEISEDERNKAISGWRRAVRACRVFTESED